MSGIDLKTLKLERGKHDDCGDGQGPVCLLEAVACYVGNLFSDHPETTSPVLAAFGRAINDAMPDDRRQELRQFIPRLVDTAGNPELEQKRAWLLTDWAVREMAPRALRSAAKALIAAAKKQETEKRAELEGHAKKLREQAKNLRALKPVDSESSARSAAESAWSARSAAWSARSAAESAGSA